MFCCYLVRLFLVLLMICVGFVVVDVFPFFVSSHSSTPDLEMTGKDSDAFIESVFDSLYKKCHPIKKNSDNANDLRLRIVKAPSFTLISGRVARRGSDVSAADWRYQTHVKKYNIFSPVLSQLFSALEILV